MKAYVELIQRRERDLGTDVLTHQKVSGDRTGRNHILTVNILTHIQWSGAEYIDNMLMTVTGGVSSTAAMGKGVTEHQFVKKQTKL